MDIKGRSFMANGSGRVGCKKTINPERVAMAVMVSPRNFRWRSVRGKPA